MKMMKNFNAYLQNQQYRQSTINGYVQNVGHFFNWANTHGLDEIENIEYKNLLEYVQYEQQRKKSVSTINLRISSVSKYFDFLKSEGLLLRNPAKTLRIKGKIKTVIQHPLKYEELLSLYNQYKTLEKKTLCQEKTDLVHQRNIIILGLLIWQGLHSGELQKLEVNHINLNEGLIYIPSTSRSNSRELKLSNQQILTLHTYIHGGVREKLNPKNEELIPGNLHNTISLLTQVLKGINPVIKNALHIRSSVILYWLTLHNKRQVQYMVGHRYITSTEGYEVQQLEPLIDQLSKHHPFG